MGNWGYKYANYDSNLMRIICEYTHNKLARFYCVFKEHEIYIESYNKIIFNHPRNINYDVFYAHSFLERSSFYF